MPGPGPRSRSLVVYLIKSEFSDAGDILSTPPNDLHVFDVALTPACTGKLYVQPSTSRPPQWLSLFDGVAGLNAIHLSNSSTSAVLLVSLKKRMFAITFGYGRHLLEPGICEENFGLRVTLNSVDPTRIRSIDRKSFDAISRHTREQASKEVPVGDFGLDVEQDLLRAVTGPPTNTALGVRLSGMDALAATVKIGLGDIPHLLAEYLKKFADTSYRSKFPWVDHIAEVRDPRERTRLDDLLVDRLRRGELERMWLAVPAIIDWSDVAGFRYIGRGTDDLADDLYLPDFLASLDDLAALSADALRKRKVSRIGVATERALDQWPLYQCLYAEIDSSGNTFLLNGGAWYRLESNFVLQVNKEVGKISSTSLVLPPYAQNSEGEYNRAVSASNPKEFALMDCKLIVHGGKHSRIEFCDLYSRTRVMVHVKRYGGSSVLSHLFGQGVNSAELFNLDPDFRERVNKILPPSHRLKKPTEQIHPGNYEVAYGIISKSKRDLVLPFFSRLNLRNASRRLRGLGYNVSISKISTVPS